MHSPPMHVHTLNNCILSWAGLGDFHESHTYSQSRILVPRIQTWFFVLGILWALLQCCL